MQFPVCTYRLLNLSLSKVSRDRREVESDEIIVHDDHGHEHHIPVEEALEQVMVATERKRHHSMMGMLGLDANRLDFDYERHFPEHDLPNDVLKVHDEDFLPPGVDSRPRPVSGVIFRISN